MQEPHAVLDFDALLARCLGDLDLVQRVLNKFLNRVPEDLTQIDESILAGDAKKTARLAHALKGAAASLSADSIREVAMGLEDAVRSEEPDAARASLSRLRNEWNRFLEYAPTLLASANARSDTSSQRTY
jgi:HPt (histidine-containing phosphotransfer) domain-containing protein